MKMTVRFSLLAALVALLCSGAAFADSPGKHPAYLHALSDLRNARAFLTYKPGSHRVDADEQRAADEITAAIEEIRAAAVDDGKPLEERMAPDAGWTRTDRLHHVMQLLDKAREDCREHESNGYVKDTRHQAVHHIDLARKAVKKAIEHQGRE
jgi:hypothetical protein